MKSKRHKFNLKKDLWKLYDTIFAVLGNQTWKQKSRK